MSNPSNAMHCLSLSEKFLGSIEPPENDMVSENQLKQMPKELFEQVSSGVQEKWIPASWALMLPMLCACATCCIGIIIRIQYFNIFIMTYVNGCSRKKLVNALPDQGGTSLKMPSSCSNN